jgi:beta-N-acetylhexosaminidase
VTSGPLRSRPHRSAPSEAVRSARRRAALGFAVAVALGAAACTGTSTTQVEVKAATTEKPAATTTTSPPDCAEMLPPEAQAAQLLMAMVRAPTAATELVAAGTLGGIALKGDQTSDVGEQITEAIASTPLPVTVASDEEGGTVQRMRLATGRIPSAAAMAEGTPQEAAQVMAEHSARIRELGVTMNFAPVADVGSGSGLGTRSFGEDPMIVSSFVEALLPAISGAGVVPVVKHWPGLGSGGPDPHQKLPTLDELAVLRGRDLVPFDRAIAAGAPAVMVTHAAVPGLTGDGEPASLSRAAITGELRGRQGFDGLVVTDDLEMGAVSNLTTQDQAAELAIAAGADVALVGSPDVVPDTHARLVDAINAGRLAEDQVVASVRRVLATKGITGPCLDAVARYSALQRQGTATDDGAATTGSSGSTGSSSTSNTSSTSTPSGGPAVTIVETGPPTTRGPGTRSTTTTGG